MSSTQDVLINLQVGGITGWQNAVAPNISEKVNMVDKVVSRAGVYVGTFIESSDPLNSFRFVVEVLNLSFIG